MVVGTCTFARGVSVGRDGFVMAVSQASSSAIWIVDAVGGDGCVVAAASDVLVGENVSVVGDVSDDSSVSTDSIISSKLFGSTTAIFFCVCLCILLFFFFCSFLHSSAHF